MSAAGPLVGERNAVVSLATVKTWERMRSGGRRGLQIPWSGASGVRGGFDSHAFPPLWGLVTLLIALSLSQPLHAQVSVPPPAPDSSGRVPARVAPPESLATHAPGDSVRVGTTSSFRDTAASRIEVVGPEDLGLESEKFLEEAAEHRAGGRLAAKPAGRWDAPRYVMMRSAILPGWGQFHNHAWIKGLAVAGGEIALITGLLDDNRELGRLSKAADDAVAAGDEIAYNAAVNAYNNTLAQSTSRKWWLGGLLAYALADAYVDAHFARFNVEFDTGHDKKTKKITSRLSVGWSF